MDFSSFSGKAPGSLRPTTKKSFRLPENLQAETAGMLMLG